MQAMIRFIDTTKGGFEAELDAVLSRTQLNLADVEKSVADILADVRTRGDKALYEWTAKFDKHTYTKDTVAVTEAEFAEAYKSVDKATLDSLKKAISNVLTYHKAQLKEKKLTEKKGTKIGMLLRPIARAGIYVPGGTAPYPSSVLMTVLPAISAGVAEIVVCSPNLTNPLTLVALKECFDTASGAVACSVYKVGGAQAIGAMAYGTESIRKVDVIAGPGNIFVTTAKKQVFGSVKIDMIAGPSEILIIADNTARADYVSADMLSQAEHDKLSASILITTSRDVADEVKWELASQLTKLPRKAIAEESLAKNGAIILVKTMDEAVALAERIAPEHLELCVKEPQAVLPKITTAGAVFVGNYSPEPLGDYFAGPSHVLPTSGTAKHFEVLNAETFMRKMSYIEYEQKSLLAVAPDITRLAEIEGFRAHANSINIRKK